MFGGNEQMEAVDVISFCLYVQLKNKFNFAINSYFYLIQMNKSEYLHLFKVVLVGNSCVGKSSIVIRYADN